MVVICFELTSQCSAKNVQTKWWPEVKHNCPGVPIILVGTKLDLRDNDQSMTSIDEKGEAPCTYQQVKSLVILAYDMA